jgi:hypothetical protein
MSEKPNMRNEDPAARLSITLPRHLYRSIRLKALDADLTVQAFMCKVIRKALDDNELL